MHWRDSVRELASPLMLAAYAAWGAVWLSTVEPLVAPALAEGIVLRAALLAFLLLFVLATLWEGHRSWPRFIATTSGLALSALAVAALAPGGASPILLVLLAAVLSTRLTGLALGLALAASNLALLAIVVLLWDAGVRYTLVLLAAFASFQIFAALVMRQAQRAEAMAADLRESNAALQATRSLLEQGARDAERLRLSRELHDVAGHALTALKLNLGALARDPRQPDPERVALCTGLADDLLQNLRGVVRQMRLHDGFDLYAAITRLAEPFPRPRVHVDIAADAMVDSGTGAEALLRTVQEGLTNAARHSQAENLWVVVQREGDALRLVVRDDGRGGAGLQPGSGLIGMRERLRAIGGELEIDGRDGAGLRLQARIPDRNPA